MKRGGSKRKQPSPIFNLLKKWKIFCFLFAVIFLTCWIFSYYSPTKIDIELDGNTKDKVTLRCSSPFQENTAGSMVLCYLYTKDEFNQEILFGANIDRAEVIFHDRNGNRVVSKMENMGFRALPNTNRIEFSFKGIYGQAEVSFTGGTDQTFYTKEQLFERSQQKMLLLVLLFGFTLMALPLWLLKS